MTQAAASAGAPQLETEERRRSVVLFLLGLAAVVKVVEVPKEVRRFLFYINETKFGWDGVNYTEWHALFRPRTCVPGKLEIVVDGRTLQRIRSASS